jgi:drug/metabolite transporter (DMT)-like permease
MSARYRDTAILLLLAAIWGFSYIFIRVAVPAFGPVGVALTRVAIGASGLLTWMAISGQLGQLPRINRPFLILASLNALIPYTLIAFAELHVAASFAAIINATTPPITAAIATIMARDRFSPALVAGMASGVLGVAVLVGWSPMPITGMVVLAVIAMIISSVSYGCAGIYAKRSFAGVSSLSMAVGQQISASMLLIPIGLGSFAVGEADKPMTLNPVLAMIGLGLVCTSFAYLLYFHLIHAVGPVRTSMVTFLIPPFGILWGWMFLDEHIKPSMLIGLALILISIRLVNRQPAANQPDPEGSVVAKPARST